MQRASVCRGQIQEASGDDAVSLPHSAQHLLRQHDMHTPAARTCVDGKVVDAGLGVVGHVAVWPQAQLGAQQRAGSSGVLGPAQDLGAAAAVAAGLGGLIGAGMQGCYGRWWRSLAAQLVMMMVLHCRRVSPGSPILILTSCAALLPPLHTLGVTAVRASLSAFDASLATFLPRYTPFTPSGSGPQLMQLRQRGAHRTQGTGHRAQGTGHRAQGTGHRAQGTGHRAQARRV
jgi:hypothetical protein